MYTSIQLTKKWVDLITAQICEAISGWTQTNQFPFCSDRDKNRSPFKADKTLISDEVVKNKKQK